MLATLLRALLILELAFYFLAGAWLHAAHGWTVSHVVLAAAALGLGLRLALVCATMILSWAARSPREPSQQLGALGTLRLVLGEWRAMLVDNFWDLPFEALALRADGEPRPGGAVPVLMVQGYFSNRGLFRALVRALDREGVGPVFTVRFPGLFRRIESSIEPLEERVRQILAASGHARIVLVCHSMGGLIAREWMARHGASRVAALVTLGSPHHGSRLSRLAVGANAAQMRPHSDFLRGLAHHEGPAGPGCSATSIYSVHDNLVMPQESSRLAWATNIAIHGVGHVDLLASPRLHAVLVPVLRAAGAGRP